METETNTAEWLKCNCDGSGPHDGPAEVRVYPLGSGGNLILCRACWAKENRYRFNRGKEMKRPQDWPQENWYTASVYSQMTEL